MEKERVRLVKELLRLGAFLQREANRLLAEYNLNQQQFVVLKTVQERGPVSQKEICSDLLFEKSNVSKIVNKLERGGLVTTSWADRDARISLIEITGKGLRLIDVCLDRLNKWNFEWTSRLSDAEVKQAGKFLNKLSDANRNKGGLNVFSGSK